MRDSLGTLCAMTERNILINRAPVLTLWATTVTERLGFDEDKALSLGKAVAGLTAQSKGQRLGIYKPVPQEVKKARARRGKLLDLWIFAYYSMHLTWNIYAAAAFQL